MGILHLERRSLYWNYVFMTARIHWWNLCIKSWMYNCVISQDSPDMRVHLVQPKAQSEYYCWMFTLCLHCFANPTWHVQYRLISNRWVGLSWAWAYIAVSMIDWGMCKLEINALALLTAIYSLRLININSRSTWLNITLILIIYQLGCVIIDGSKSTKATKIQNEQHIELQFRDMNNVSVTVTGVSIETFCYEGQFFCATSITKSFPRWNNILSLMGSDKIIAMLFPVNSSVSPRTTCC